MDLIKLVIVFAVVIGLVANKKSMSTAVIIGSIACWILYKIPANVGAITIANTVTSLTVLKMIGVMYVITFMQRMMEKKNAINTARDGLSGLFNSRWVNCAAAPIFIGLLPSPNAAFIAGDMVEASASEYLSKEEMAVTTSYFRHVSEAFLPTYQNIILALAITGYSASQFVIGMIPMVIVLIVLGILFFLKGKVPNKTGQANTTDKKEDIKKVAELWPILATIVLIVAFNIDTLYAAIRVIVVYFFVGKFKAGDVAPFFVSAFESKIVFNTLAVYIFKNFLELSGAIKLLPGFFSKFPIPTFLIFVLIFLFGTLVAGSMTMTASVLPVAMESVPNAGLPLVCLLMMTSYIAMQISPTHICLSIVSEHFDVSLGDMVKKTIPLLVVFTIIAIAYYLLLTTIGIG
ncbi:MAG: DUF401 family protein [Oscillospiraceae bacterium]|nr:DUF401 family protein [Oscillospiraceae bacterium]